MKTQYSKTVYISDQWLAYGAKSILLLVISLLSNNSYCQVYNLNNSTINLGGTGVTITPKIGTGTNSGDIVLYENVVTLNGQSIDAIVETVSITNGSIITYDYTGTSQNNQQRWFSPQASFNSGGGSLEFRISFILNGSYSNFSNSGDAVTLTNLVLNSYDIDGNGNTNSNQYCDFGGFASSELGNPTNLEYQYYPSTGLTRFRSTSYINNTNAADEINRVKLSYSYVSTMDIILGGEGNGAAYYYLDFSSGDTFASSTVFPVPSLDLNTTTSGADNDTIFEGNPVPFTFGDVNIIYDGTSIDVLTISFDNTMLLDGSSEELIVDGSTTSAIALDFTDGQVIPNLSVGSNLYAVTAKVTGTNSELQITKSDGGQITLSEAELLIDALRYDDFASDQTVSNRYFDVKVRDGEFESNVAQFTIVFSAELPIELIDFTAVPMKGFIRLDWNTATENSTMKFIIERSVDFIVWEVVGEQNAAGNSSIPLSYSMMDNSPVNGLSYYRIIHEDIDGKMEVFTYCTVDYKCEDLAILSDASGNASRLILPSLWIGSVTITNLYGKIFLVNTFNQQSTPVIELNQFVDENGIVLIKCESEAGDYKVFEIYK